MLKKIAKVVYWVVVYVVGFFMGSALGLGAQMLWDKVVEGGE